MGSKNLSVFCDYGNKELHKKFTPMLIYCQRWCHNEKTKTSVTFNIAWLWLAGFFKVIFFEDVSNEKKKITCLILNLSRNYQIQKRFWNHKPV